jgi:hypothetical protein
VLLLCCYCVAIVLLLCCQCVSSVLLTCCLCVANVLLYTQARIQARRRKCPVAKIESEHLAKMRQPPGWKRTLSRIWDTSILSSYRGALRAADVIRNAPALALAPCLPSLKESVTLDKLLMVYADQILEHGCLNCDPHPGNVLLMPDGFFF